MVYRRDEVLAKLASVRDELREKHRVQRLELFGSVAHDQATPESDIDVMVTFEPDAKIDLFDVGRLVAFLEELLDAEDRVDLVERDSVRPRLRERIYGEAIDAA